MSNQLEETAMLGLRAHSLDDLRRLKPDTKDPILTTAYHSRGWIAVAFDKDCYPICSIHGNDKTLLGALRYMLKHTSERNGNGFVTDFLRVVELHDGGTSSGVDFKVRN